MANYRNLFPNLTGDDFLAPGAAKTNGNANYVVNWAEHDNTATIPYDKLPDLSLNAQFTFNATAATDSATALTAFIAEFAADTGTYTLTAGDYVLVTAQQNTGGDASDDVLFTFVYVGRNGISAATSDGGTTTVLATDFRTISDASQGVSSIQAGTGIQLAGASTNGQFFGPVTITSTPSIAPYTVVDITTATNVSDGEIVALGIIATDITATLPSTPTAGASIKFVNFNTGAGEWTIGRNSSNIMGVAEDLVLDDNTVSFELVFMNATRGWAIVGAN